MAATTGAVSGLGEAALDRAVADPAWLRERLIEVEQGRPRRALDWAQLALQRADLQLRWASTADRASARELEDTALGILAASGALWNRRAARRAPSPEANT